MITMRCSSNAEPGRMAGRTVSCHKSNPSRRQQHCSDKANDIEMSQFAHSLKKTTVYVVDFVSSMHLCSLTWPSGPSAWPSKTLAVGLRLWLDAARAYPTTVQSVFCVEVGGGL